MIDVPSIQQTSLGPEIVVTAKALPDPASERAFGVERIGRDALRRAPSREIDQILKDAAGVQQFRRSDSRSSHPTSQGVTMRALGGNASSRALLTLDGVPQADPFGGWINWPAYDPASLGEIRIVRGGGSVANGPGALAGTIELTSDLASGLLADIAGGSRASLEGSIVAGLDAGAGTLNFTASGARGDGFTPITAETRGPVDRPAPYSNATARALWTMPVADQLQLQASASGFADKRDRGVDFTGNRTTGGDASVRLTSSGRWAWSALIYGQLRELRSSFASIGDGRSSVQRAALQDEVPSRGLGARFEVRPPGAGAMELRFGADARLVSGESRELYSYVSGAPPRRRVAGGDSWTAGLFAEATRELEGVTLSGGVRLDHWSVDDGRLLERTIATGGLLRDDRYADRDGWLPTARAGAIVPLGKSWSARGAAYLGWRMPTLNELFRPFRAGPDATAANPLLDPEKLRGVEAGLEYSRGAFDASATLFAHRLSDAIANVTLGEGPGQFPGVGFVPAGGVYRQRQNLDAVVVRGLELSGGIVSGPWTARTSASFTNAEVYADGPAASLDGLRPAQTPRTALSASLGWTQERRAASLVVRHVGNQFEDDLNQRKLSAATTLDASLTWPLTRSIQLVGRAENLFDALVEAGRGNDGSVERATPRTVWLGLRFVSPGRD